VTLKSLIGVEDLVASDLNLFKMVRGHHWLTLMSPTYYPDYQLLTAQLLTP